MSDVTIGIGELARRAGLPVRTVRFYCDEGLLAARRSAGGHRRFDPDAVERLRLVRRLRGLGLGLPSIAGVLNGERALDEAVAAERAALDVEVAALAWRRASLRAVEEAGPAERAARLDLLAAAGDGRSAHAAITGFWRDTMMAPLSPRMLAEFLDGVVPDPPADPTPAQVVAYAGMVAITADRGLVRRLRARGAVNAGLIADEGTLLRGIDEACRLAAPEALSGRAPRPGPALDRLVAAHAEVRGARDTPEFRRHLRTVLVDEAEPRMGRYWHLAGEVAGRRSILGAGHRWLVEALAVPA
ncbi:MerR family transcriptional regulator [Actinomadura viridis]|uniref:DNA-binding transcriptional MerR regulator n=1 Tax=Actinomadura viridis TaxID=58110 RepID=A0A931GS74_9ACTN|nr:MerR family transcriptional regulator [Actinomadura viridis]MBG6090514.1 DNA-binding transcriptional MerR regulator [Actinomadura viridis]